jgi:hypothetical protein
MNAAVVMWEPWYKAEQPEVKVTSKGWIDDGPVLTEHFEPLIEDESLLEIVRYFETKERSR